jgi:hypothetical protein
VKKIAPHIPVIDKSRREDGSLSRADFTFDKERNVYVCPRGKRLRTTGTIHGGETILYRARTYDCGPCPLKAQCCPKAPERKVPRSIHENARDAARALASTDAFAQSRRDRKRVEMLFAHLKRILRLGRLRLRGPRGAQDEFTLAAIAQNLRRLAKLVVRLFRILGAGGFGAGGGRLIKPREGGERGAGRALRARTFAA